MTLKTIGLLQCPDRAGHSIIVIEHNTDIIKSADWIIDLGPEAGDAGGNLVYAGVPAGIKKVKESYTAKYLRYRTPNFECRSFTSFIIRYSYLSLSTLFTSFHLYKFLMANKRKKGMAEANTEVSRGSILPGYNFLSAGNTIKDSAGT